MFINDLKTAYDEDTNTKTVSSEMDSEKVGFSKYFFLIILL